MPSIVHQFITICLIRKMKEKGYEIIAFNGDYTKIDTIAYKIPPQILRHRPDILGIKRETLNLCIGEAKTTNDLFSKRTKDQLVDYFYIISSSLFHNCELIIGIPQKAEEILKNLLNNLGLMNANNISYLLIPEILFPKTEDNEEI